MQNWRPSLKIIIMPDLKKKILKSNENIFLVAYTMGGMSWSSINNCSKRYYKKQIQMQNTY